jgi:hypothetical protein
MCFEYRFWSDINNIFFYYVASDNKIFLAKKSQTSLRRARPFTTRTRFYLDRPGGKNNIDNSNIIVSYGTFI